MQDALRAENLSLAWDNSQVVVSNLTLSVGQGEITCLVGKSGVGKTTILHALAGLLAPKEGRVLLYGQDITGKPGHISYMLQKDLLLPNLRVIDNACLPLVLTGTPKPLAREQALPLLERFGLAEVAHKWPAELSGGMRQRVAFARTCLQGNNVVLLDEPFSALDAITRADLRTWFAETSRAMGLSTLVITHDPDEAALLADRISVIGTPTPEEPACIVGEVVPKRARTYPPAPQGEQACDDRLADYAHITSAAGSAIPVNSADAALAENVSDGTWAADYSLTTEFLEAKSEILSLLR